MLKNISWAYKLCCIYELYTSKLKISLSYRNQPQIFKTARRKYNFLFIKFAHSYNDFMRIVHSILKVYPIDIKYSAHFFNYILF